MFIDAHNHLGVRHGASQTAAELVAKLDLTGVDRAVVFPFVEGDFDNAVIDEAVAQAPDRLIPFCAVNPWHRKDAVDELYRCAELGFRGVKLHPTLHGYHLSDPALVDPIFAAVRETGMIVICHGASDLYNAPPEFARIARRFPEVSLLMAHSGTFWSHEQAIEVAKETPNLYLETARVPVFEVAESVRELGPEKVVWG
ncbi:MAG: amidohydrolase family protein, partial [Sphaerisporangium sp.]|nr:amidohydrolase family protein [Sphaerisporangium sp.]